MVHKTNITPTNFTPTMGAYSHGVRADVGDSSWIFVTGQIALDDDGHLVSDDIEEQTRFVFNRIERILREAGASFADVVKAQIFVTDISDFSRISPIRNEFFAESQPVSTLVEVSALVSKGCKIEIEVIAIV